MAGMAVGSNDGKPTGPLDVAKLKTIIALGNFNSDCLVWKDGMPEWQKAGNQSELK